MGEWGREGIAGGGRDLKRNDQAAPFLALSRTGWGNALLAPMHRQLHPLPPYRDALMQTCPRIEGEGGGGGLVVGERSGWRLGRGMVKG